MKKKKKTKKKKKKKVKTAGKAEIIKAGFSTVDKTCKAIFRLLQA